MTCTARKQYVYRKIQIIMSATTLKNNFSARLSNEDAELLSDVKTLLEDASDIEFTTDRQLFPYILEAALSKKKPIQVSKPDDLAEITRLKTLVNGLQNEIIELNTCIDFLKTENSDLKTVNTGLETENSELKTLVITLETVNTELKTLVNTLGTECKQLKTNLQSSELAENEVIVRLNKFQLQLFGSILKNKEFIAICRKNNENGKMSGFSDLVDTNDLKTNLANLLTSVTTGSAYQKQMIEIFSRVQINRMFIEYKKTL